MEKILTIDGRQVKFKSTGAFLLRYKAQFKKDGLQDIFKMQDAISNMKGGECNNPSCAYSIEGICTKPKNIEVLDLETFYNLVWTLAKTADPDMLPPFEWLDSFGEFPLEEIMPELEDLLTASMGSTVKSKKK